MAPTEHLSETLVTGLRDTLAELESGLAQVPAERALELVRGWRERLSAGEGREVKSIVSDLQAVEALISTDASEIDRVGLAVAALGEHVLAAAPLLDDDDSARLALRLGDLLFHAGHALRGPIPSPTTSPS